MKGLASEAARKEEELQLFRSQISSYQPIVERVQRQEASEKARAEAEKRFHRRVAIASRPH
jgi:SMC interacting uncharacterized protein involved in chromosome segregation